MATAVKRVEKYDLLPNYIVQNTSTKPLTKQKKKNMIKKLKNNLHKDLESLGSMLIKEYKNKKYEGRHKHKVNHFLKQVIKYQLEVKAIKRRPEPEPKVGDRQMAELLAASYDN